MTAREAEARTLVYEFEVEIAATATRVWEALTRETNDWWLADFHMVGPDSVVSLDARAGGQLIERQAEGGSLLWYTVTLCDPGKSLYLVGHIAPDWGGPATTMLALKLVARNDMTVLQVQDAILGRVNEASAATLEAGWKQLFTEGLKAHLEGCT